MKLKIISIAIIFLSILSCSNNDEEPPIGPQPDPILKKVLIIGIDGCMPVGVMTANTPNLDALMANGTFSMDARNIKTTSSGPAWSSILTGVWEEKHGVIDNTFNGSKFDSYPHFFKHVKEVYPESRTVSICEWSPINDHIAQSYADITRNSSNAADTGSKAVAELGVDQLTSMFLHFDAPDHAGHSSGFSPSNSHYIDAIEEVDKEIGPIITAMKARENYVKEDWIVIVTTDHGGLGNSHGGNSEEERTVFMIVSGDNVPNKEISKTTTQTTIPPVENCLDSDTELYFKRDGIIEVPNNSAHNFGATQDFSIECRFRSDSPDDVAIVAKKDWVSGLKPGYVFSFKPNTQKFKVNIGDGNTRVDLETEIITDNQWHTVSATFDRDGMLSVYIDGEFSKSISMSSIGNIDVDLPFTIGADGNNSYKFDGYISEVRVFNSLLTSEEIKNWNCKVMDNSHPQYDHVQSYYKITEGTGNIINDLGPKGLHGSLNGAEWKDANTDQIINIDNFDNTPRSVDATNTALIHLCITIESVWKLDGNSLILTECD